MFFENKELNTFMGSGALGTAIDDFNGDNFDHGGLGFFGGGIISSGSGGARPIGHHPVPPGTPRWGREWKQAAAKWYNRTLGVGSLIANYAHRANYLDLDPTYRNSLGRPLIRMTYNYRDNDRKLVPYMAGRIERIASSLGGNIVAPSRGRLGDFNVVPYQTTHNTGGTIMGSDPRTSVVNRYLQSWDADNLFIMGASVFPQNTSYNPTATVGALAYWSAAAIIGQYIKNPGPLVPA